MSVDKDEILIYLQNLLINELNLPEKNSDGLMFIQEAKVDDYCGLRIYINSDEHAPAHFHVSCQEFKASFTIENCTKLNGTINNTELKKLKRWYSNNIQLLIDVWNMTRPSDCPVGEYRYE